MNTIQTDRRRTGVADTSIGIATNGGSSEGMGAVSDEAEQKIRINDFFANMRAVGADKRQAASLARQSLSRLIEVCATKTGQAYKIRALLFSLWNGKPAPLIDLLDLDYSLRGDLLMVGLAFGWDGDAQEPEFFYDAIKYAFEDRGLFTWFLKEGEGS